MAEKLVSMKMSKKEAKREFGPVPQSESAQDLPKYPYELRIRLDSESLAKLKLDVSEYEVGQECEIHAKGEVIGIEVRQHQSGEDLEDLEIQITELSIDWDGDEDERAKGDHLNALAGYRGADE